jgi:hypothetical protein
MLTNPGWIYAAREEGSPLIKIGYTQNHVRYRIQGLRREFKAAVILIAATHVRDYVYQVERRVHTLLAAQRITGEWFYLHMSQQALDALVAQAYADVQDDIAKNGWNSSTLVYTRNYNRTHPEKRRVWNKAYWAKRRAQQQSTGEP